MYFFKNVEDIAQAKNSLKDSTFIFTGHPLYRSFIIIMLTNRKCEHTDLSKSKNSNKYNLTIHNYLAVTLKLMIVGFFKNLNRKRKLRSSNLISIQ